MDWVDTRGHIETKGMMSANWRMEPWGKIIYRYDRYMIVQALIPYFICISKVVWRKYGFSKKKLRSFVSV